MPTSSSIKHVIKTHTSLIKNSSESEVKIFPNPANTEIFIEYKCDAIGKFVLFNSLGQEVLTSEVSAGNKKVIISSMSLTAGVYSYRLVVESCIDKAGKLTILK